MNSTAAPCARRVLMTSNSRSDLDAGQRGRRLVHHEHPRVERQRLGDLDDLLVGDRQAAREAGRVERDTEAGEDLRAPALHGAAVDAPAGADAAGGP